MLLKQDSNTVQTNDVSPGLYTACPCHMPIFCSSYVTARYRRSVLFYVLQQTMWIIRNGEPWTATSTFTQLLNCWDKNDCYTSVLKGTRLEIQFKRTLVPFISHKTTACACVICSGACLPESRWTRNQRSSVLKQPNVP